MVSAAATVSTMAMSGASVVPLPLSLEMRSPGLRSGYGNERSSAAGSVSGSTKTFEKKVSGKTLMKRSSPRSGTAEVSPIAVRDPVEPRNSSRGPPGGRPRDVDFALRPLRVARLGGLPRSAGRLDAWDLRVRVLGDSSG